MLTVLMVVSERLQWGLAVFVGKVSIFNGFRYCGAQKAWVPIYGTCSKKPRRIGAPGVFENLRMLPISLKARWLRSPRSEDS